MIWIIKGTESHQAIGCNIEEKPDGFELWITRPTGKGFKLMKGSLDEVKEHKNMIDTAVRLEEKVVELA